MVTNLPHKLLSTGRKIRSLRKALTNTLLFNKKLLKIQLSKVVRSRGFLGRHIGSLLRIELAWIKNVLITLGLTTAVSATYTANSKKEKKTHGSGMTTLIISNRKITDFMKIVKYFKEPGLLIKSVNETIKKKAKK